MAVNEAQSSFEEAVKLRCRHCSVKETCSRKERKENYENSGIVTYCAITPDKKKRKKRRR